jgi:hypothetical protein
MSRCEVREFKRWRFYCPYRENVFLDVLLSILIITLLVSFAAWEMPVATKKAERLRVFSDAQMVKMGAMEYFAVRGAWPTREVTRVDYDGGRVLEVKFASGAIQVETPDHHNAHAVPKVLSLRPATLIQNNAATVAWVCGNAAVPEGMHAAGENATTLRHDELYSVCR